MATFRYSAVDENQQPASGEIGATSVREAVDALEARGFAIRSIEQVQAVDSSEQQPVPIDASPLCAPFEKLFAHRATLVPGLSALREELSSNAMRLELEQIIRLIQQDDVQQAVLSFESHAGHWTPLLSAAATRAQSDEVLSEYLRRLHNLHQDRQRRWIQLTYPLLLLVLAAALIVAMSLMVIPTFREIFREFGMELPDATLLILAIAEAIQSGWMIYFALALLASVLVGSIALRHLPAGVREWVSRWTLRRGRQLTIVGQLENYVADLLEAGLSPQDALREAATAIHHPAMTAWTRKLANRLSASRGTFDNLGRRLLTHTFTLAMEPDIADQSRIHLLRELGQAHADRMTSRLIWKQGLLFGPLAILVVGVTVGFTVLALFLPLVRLVEGLS